MSTIKSSSANLTLNADGSGNDIKFQSNAVEKASIDQDGNVAASGTITDGEGNVRSGRKNMIINGGMQVAQRGTSSTSSGYYTIDRFKTTGSGNFDQLQLTQAQVSESPSGFSNSHKLTIQTAETAIAADESYRIFQDIEAQNLQHLAFGTSDAKQITISFWVRSSLTGTYAQSIYSQDGNRIIGDTYTVDVADTWEYKTISYAGDTGGTINNDTGLGFRVNWYLIAGTDESSGDNSSWSGWVLNESASGHTAAWGLSTSHDFHLTGVQLEVGSAATDFEHRSYGEELALCQRYYEKSYNSTTVPGVASLQPGFASTANNAVITTQAPGATFKVTKRSNPTIVTYNAVTGASGKAYRVSDASNETITLSYIGQSAIGYINVPASSNGYYYHYTADSEI